ncbi:DUF5808 domain-containing protein [Labilibaculum sp.]|uniref:DUF5808 domain-containing protein n=1 Tax=Labilibaculum sp. TaxID=2060723 RepID=UPI003564CB62
MRNKVNKQKTDNWIGVLYFNRKDSRVIVPKRISGMGWTLNFANPYTYIMVIVIILIITLSNHFL